MLNVVNFWLMLCMERENIYKLELEIVYLLNFVERDLVVYKKILYSYLFFIYSFFFNICKY